VLGYELPKASKTEEEEEKGSLLWCNGVLCRVEGKLRVKFLVV
jgi:hypothetical protein